MSRDYTLSPFMAILININVMLGSGIFINTTELAHRTGFLGFTCYIIVGLLLLPLVASMATILRLNSAGGFYSFAAQEVNPFFGFLNTWSYFTGKLGSCSTMIHISVLILQQLIPALAAINTIIIDLVILGIFIGLNMLNMRTGTIIQGMFTTLKMIPIIFVILTGIFFFNLDAAAPQHMLWSGIPLSIPLVLYALIGFEVVCSISSHIKNAAHNAPRVIFASYGIALCIIVLFQFMFYGMLGDSLANQATFRGAYPELLTMLMPTNLSFGYFLSSFFNLAIASSALGGAYGILFSNSWNLHTLARYNHLFKSSWFSRLNSNNIPFLCVIAEGIICITYLIASGGKQIVLQQLGALGVITSYSFSIIALAIAKKNNPHYAIKSWIPLLGIANCLLLIAACIRGLVLTGPLALIAFTLLLVAGSGMFWYKNRKNLSC